MLAITSSRRIYLEDLSVEKHLHDYHEMWSNPKALIWSYVFPTAGPPKWILMRIDRTQEAKKTLEESKAWLERMTKSPSRPWIANYAIMYRRSLAESAPKSQSTADQVLPRDKLIGTVGVHGMAEVAEGRRYNIGYMINYDYWGHGHATEALEEFLWLWFNDGRKEDLVAEVDTENWASLRILKKMTEKGYVIREGELTKGEFRIPGKGPRDMRTWYISQNAGLEKEN